MFTKILVDASNKVSILLHTSTIEVWYGMLPRSRKIYGCIIYQNLNTLLDFDVKCDSINRFQILVIHKNNPNTKNFRNV